MQAQVAERQRLARLGHDRANLSEARSASRDQRDHVGRIEPERGAGLLGGDEIDDFVASDRQADAGAGLILTLEGEEAQARPLCSLGRVYASRQSCAGRREHERSP